MALSVEEKAAQIMEHLCSHSAHGYSQPNRQGVGTGGPATETVRLSDGSTVKISPGDRDCSSAVIECFEAQGIDCGGASYTGDMASDMLKSGNFKKLPASTWRNPKRGDILLRPGVHTALALGNGKLGEAVSSERGTITGKLGDQTGKEVLVRSLYDDGWTCVLRYCGKQPSGEPKLLQCIANGYWGTKVTRVWQAINEIEESGIVYRQPKSSKRYLKAMTSDNFSNHSFVFVDDDEVGEGSLCIRRLQNRKLGIPWSTCTGVFDATTRRLFIEKYCPGYEQTKTLNAPSTAVRNFAKEINAEAKEMGIKR